MFPGFDWAFSEGPAGDDSGYGSVVGEGAWIAGSFVDSERARGVISPGREDARTCHEESARWGWGLHLGTSYYLCGLNPRAVNV